MMNAFSRYALIIFSLISAIPFISAQNSPQNYSNFNLVLLNNTLYALGSYAPSFEIWSLSLSQPFTTTTAIWQSRLNSTNLNSLVQPYRYGVAYGDSFGILYAEAGEGGTNELATNIVEYNTNSGELGSPVTSGVHGADRMAMTANMDSNDIAWYFGGASPNADGSMSYFNDIYIYDANHSYWGQVFDSAQMNIRPSYSAGHTANIIKGKLFVLGGITATVNSTTNKFVESIQDFSSAMVFNLSVSDCRLMKVITSVTAPASRLEHTMAEGPDGHSLVLFGGYTRTNDSQNIFFQDVWQLDTCSMDWTKQSTTGQAPSPRAGHQAITVGNYMIVMGGYTNITSNSQRVYANDMAILDMSTWTWVQQFTPTATQTNTPVPSCEFRFQASNVGTGGSPVTPLPAIVYNDSDNSEAKKLGIGISFSTVAFLAIIGGGVYLFIRRRKRTKGSTPYWLPGMGNDNSSTGHELGVYPPANHSRMTDYPMFVYDPEGEQKKKGEIALPADPESRTYSASDQEDWRAKEEERRPSDGRSLPKHTSLWNKVRGLGDSSNDHDDQTALIKGADKNGWTKLEDYDDD